MIPGLGKSPGEEKGYPLQYSGLENSMDCIVQEDAELTHLSNFHFHFHLGYGVKCIQVHNSYFFIILCSLFIYIYISTFSINCLAWYSNFARCKMFIFFPACKLHLILYFRKLHPFWTHPDYSLSNIDSLLFSSLEFSYLWWKFWNYKSCCMYFLE